MISLALPLLLAALPTPPVYEAEIQSAVAEVAEVWPVPATLVRAVIRQESGFNPKAVSPAGARGLMQIMPATAIKVGVAESDLFIPARNILAGVRLLAALLKHYSGDVVSALVAYNSGPQKPAVLPDNGETPDYVARILRFWAEFEPQLKRQNEPRLR